MRGPHNLLRLIRTGATLERAGAMGLIMDAMDAPPLVRATMRFLAWPFQWLGYRGDPSMPPALRALTAEAFAAWARVADVDGETGEALRRQAGNHALASEHPAGPHQPQCRHYPVHGIRASNQNAARRSRR